MGSHLHLLAAREPKYPRYDQSRPVHRSLPIDTSAELTADVLRQLRVQAGEFGDQLWSRSASSDDTHRLRRYLRDYIRLLARHGVREPEQVRALVAQHAALLPAVITQPEALRPLLMADGARRLSMYNLLDAEVPLLGQEEPEPQSQRQTLRQPRPQQQQDGDHPSRVVVFSAYNKDVPAAVRDKLTASDAPLGEGELDGLLLELLQAAAQRHEAIGESGPTAPTAAEFSGDSQDPEPVKSASLSSEEIAYILIGTTAGLSVFCLVIVAVTMKCRRNCSVYALLSRLMHSEYIQGLGSRMSSARSHRSAAGGGGDAPTHKLGSWFNGRSESLGGAEKFRSNMALAGWLQQQHSHHWV
ncbi:hypothetical protein FJT64_013419 [Amphibalanus amphitrite]|uniref:Uncharacterized protein n=1 Tax=Amphibalanus amphitrite TaxID=1232801 RepID=A0A6A4V2V4_AMPAM|nr:hypothetical protein FJT64_013419 [Amphibalanus amphitrite]